MKTIDRYIASHTIWGVLSVLFLFVILFSFLELLAQINDIGKGNYQMLDVFVFTGFTVPKRIVDLMPVSILLGSIVALGLLADHNELTAMQAAGISVGRICRSVLSAGALLLLTVFVLAEFLAPPMEQYARIRRSKAIYGQGILLTKSGFWARHGHSFVHVGKIYSGGMVADVEIFEHDNQGRLNSFIHAREATVLDNNQWLLTGIEQIVFSEQGIKTQNPPSLMLNSFLSLEQVGILELPPASLSISDLYKFVQGLRQRGQNAQRYALAFWQKLSLPVTNLVMVMLSLAFIFGPTRTITAGRRIAAASMVGIALYLAYQIIGHLGLLFELPPAVTTLTPVLAVLGVALKMLGRGA
jgi:lipopolysaccharide export system permease protein